MTRFKYTQIKINSWPEVNTLFSTALKKIGCYSSIKVLSLPAKEATFSSAKTAKNYLRSGRGKPDTKYVVQVYSYSESTSFGYDMNPAVVFFIVPYAVWGLAHYLSFGLVPLWKPTDISIKAKILDGDGHEIAKSEVENSASLWAWAPFYFKSDAITFNGDIKKSRFFHRTIDILAKRTSDKISESQQGQK